MSLSLFGEGRYDRYRDTLIDSAGARHVRYYEDYTIFHLGGSWQATPWLTVNARVNNLFDKNFVNYGATKVGANVPAANANWTNSYRQVLEGRRLWVSANITF
ncbi:hypothetical protein G6F68_017769 [Rhizopus microsporus]|nr:hypothetical protein G6F68_017769 [Rhizopus microsporus]